jgi:calcineurin-like phosphoesterase family protein
MILLTADWHLDDNPDNEYRWQIIELVFQNLVQHKIDEVFILGDTWDRKDRHSAALVNRTVEGFRCLAGRAPLTILRGNHDTTLRDPSFWEFLNGFDKISYVTKPEFRGQLALLPFTPNPKLDWSEFNLSDFKALFMHVTYPGAIGENGFKLDGTKGLPIFRGSIKIYSGDVHTPQTFGNFVHVGAPHGVKFGDRFPCRMLLLDEQTFHVVDEIKLSPPRKLMLEIKSIDDLAKVRIRPGDQVKIRFTCDPSVIGEFGSTEAALDSWARESGASIAGTEVIVQSTRSENIDTNQTPEAILTQFAEKEEITDDLLGVGLSLLREV